jgi:hypothetical protein
MFLILLQPPISNTPPGSFQAIFSCSIFSKIGLYISSANLASIISDKNNLSISEFSISA